MKRINWSLLLVLLSGLVMGGNVIAADVVILECGTTFAPPPPGQMPTPDPGINIIRSSSSETPPPVDLNNRVSCSTAIAELLNLGYALNDVKVPSSNSQVYILIENKKHHR